MSFTEVDYLAAAARLAAPVSHIKAFADVESSGETTWIIDGAMVPPVRLEAHWFGKLTGYRFNDSHPDISSIEWNPALAATTRAGAWAQVRAAEALNKEAADEATSWGAFQIMGFNSAQIGFASVAEFVADMMRSAGGQMDAFVLFVQSEPGLLAAVRAGDWRTCALLYNGPGQVDVYAARLAASAAHYEDGGLPRALRLGDRGADVAAMQFALGVTNDGDFGPVTNAAVRLFQSNHGLAADGIVGAMTRKALWQRTA